MKRKKGRHKLIAIEFLSNISLDGCYNKQLPTFDHQSIRTQVDYGPNQSSHTPLIECDFQPANALCDVLEVKKTADTNCTTRLFSDASSGHGCEEPVSLNRETQQQQFFVNNPPVTPVTDGRDIRISTSCYASCSARPLFASDLTRPTFHLDIGPELSFQCTSFNKPIHQREGEFAYGRQLSTVAPLESSRKTSRRVTLCPLGLQGTRLAVFSIIPYGRRNSTITKNAVRIPRLTPGNTKWSTDAEALPISLQASQVKQQQQQQQPQQTPQPVQSHQQQQQLQQQSTSNSSGARDHLLTAFAADPVWSLSSLRPTGDEVVSFARFLKPHTNLWLSNPGAWTQFKSGFAAPFVQRDLDTANAAPGSVDRGSMSSSAEVSFNGAIRSGFVAAPFVAPAARCQTRHLSTASLGAASSWSRSATVFNRVRHPSGGPNPTTGCVPGGANLPPRAAATSAVNCPDPLVFYMPSVLDDPDLLVSAGKRVLKLPNYLTSVITYVRPSEQKRNVNREFHVRFPMIQLTLTKLRSIKSVMVRIVHHLSFDLWIAAHSHVLFEKLILRLLINKANRKLCASAVLLISAKLNDIKGTELSALIQELETSFRISRRDLIHTELDVALSLEFCLVPNESEIVPHYFRIYKSLDLTPPYPIPCLGHMPHSTSLPQAAE